MQLIGEGVAMVDTLNMKQRGVAKRIEREQVLEKFGVAPDKVIEVQALAGDSTDNIPGVPGIGIKTAAQLIDEYGNLEGLLDHAEEIKQTKRRENLIEFADLARISKQLVTLDQDVPVEVALGALGIEPVEGPKAVAYLKALGFNTLTKRVADKFGVDIEAVEPAELTITGWEPPTTQAELLASAVEGEAATPAMGAAEAAVAVKAIPIYRNAYQSVTTLEALEDWLTAARDQGYVAFDCETNSLNAMQADLVGVSLGLAPGKACYVPLGHGHGDGLDLEGAGDIEQIPMREALDALKPVLEDPAVLKVGQNLKYDILVLANHGIGLAPIDDTMLLSYSLDAGRGGHGMDELAKRHLGHTCISFKEVAGTGKSQVTFDKVPLDKATEYAAEDADVTLRLWQLLKPRLAGEGLATVYETLERPLVPVLTEMERAGVKVERQVLSRLSGQFAPGARRPRIGSSQAGRRGFQRGLAPAAWRNPIREDELGGWQEDQDGCLGDRPSGAGRPRCPGP